MDRDPCNRDRRATCFEWERARSSVLSWGVIFSSALGVPPRTDDRRTRTRGILLWLNGGPSHIDTFDPEAGPHDGWTVQSHQDARAGRSAERALFRGWRSGPTRSRFVRSIRRAKRETTVARNTSVHTMGTP